MIKKLILNIILICFLALVLSSCDLIKKEEIVQTEPVEGGNKIIEVVSVSPLSGDLESVGKALRNGGQLAVDENSDYFKELGFELRFSPRDDKGNPDVGVEMAKKIANEEKILAVMGNYNSGISIPSSEVYKEYDLLMISPASTAVDYTERGLDNVNRIVARDDAQGSVAANFSFNDLGAKKAFVINDNTAYGKGLAGEFTKAFKLLNGQISNEVAIKEGQTDFKDVLEKVKVDKADVIFFGGLYPEGSRFIKQMKDLKLKCDFVGPDGIDSPEVVKIAGDAAIGTYYTSTAGDITSTNAGIVWSSKYENKFSMKPENYTAYGYDAMGVILKSIIQAIEENNFNFPTREAVKKIARKSSDYKGLATNIAFDDKGDNKEAEMFIFGYNKVEYPPDLIRRIKVSEIK